MGRSKNPKYYYPENKSKPLKWKVLKNSVNYGTYEKESDAKKVVEELKKIGWNKDKLPEILKEHGIKNAPKYPKKKGYKKKSVIKKMEGTSKLMKYNHDLFENFATTRNIKPGTEKGYQSALAKFCDFNGEWDLQKVIDLCLKEEDEGISARNSWLKKTLLEYRTWLLNGNASSQGLGSKNTVMTYFSKLLTFFRHFEITIPYLPHVKMEKEYEVSYFDIPHHEHIRLACRDVDIELKSVILFQSSSGSAKAETLSLTVQDFLEGCRDYLEGTNIENIDECLKKLEQRQDVVPVIYLKRIKTDKYYYTCCSPEASYAIVCQLQKRLASQRETLNLDSKLFNFSSSLLLTRFQEINDDHGWGYIGHYRFFRSHTLRKFHASNLGCATEYIDSLEGRSKNVVHETYIKQNPSKIKEIYMQFMHNVMIYTDVNDPFSQINHDYKKPKSSLEGYVNIDEHDLKEPIQEEPVPAPPVEVKPEHKHGVPKTSIVSAGGISKGVSNTVSFMGNDIVESVELTIKLNVTSENMNEVMNIVNQLKAVGK